MLSLCEVIPSVVRNLWSHETIFMSRSFDCYVQGCLLFQFVDGNEKNVTIRRDDLKATEQNYPVVL